MPGISNCCADAAGRYPNARTVSTHICQAWHPVSLPQENVRMILPKSKSLETARDPLRRIRLEPKGIMTLSKNRFFRLIPNRATARSRFIGEFSRWHASKRSTNPTAHDSLRYSPPDFRDQWNFSKLDRKSLTPQEHSEVAGQFASQRHACIVVDLIVTVSAGNGDENLQNNPISPDSPIYENFCAIKETTRYPKHGGYSLLGSNAITEETVTTRQISFRTSRVELQPS